MLTFGCWSNKQVKSYDLVELADKYDDDPEDTDSNMQQSERLLGKRVLYFGNYFRVEPF